MRIAAEAAALARATGKPVQLTWSRWQEALAGFPRMPVAARLDAGMGPDRQQLLGWRARIACPASLRETAARVVNGEGAACARARWQDSADPLALEGAMPPYAIPECAVEHVPVHVPLPTARMRGGGHAISAFLTESFIDECAHFGGAEPLAFRMAMLGHQPRLAACLQGVARAAMWGGGGCLGAGDRLPYDAARHARRPARGACGRGRHRAKAGRCDPGGAPLRLCRHRAGDQRRSGAPADRGRADLRPRSGGGGSTGYAGGRPLAGRLGQLGLPLLADCPKVDIVFIDGPAQLPGQRDGEAFAPFDPGELGVVAVAPAIANALFSATGLRLRRLPLLSEGL
jgi:isoquinoline 1-oxidoreductase beta subunit